MTTKPTRHTIREHLRKANEAAMNLDPVADEALTELIAAVEALAAVVGIELSEEGKDDQGLVG